MSKIEIIQSVTAIGSLLISILGFGVVIFQMRQIKKTLQSDTHSKLYAEDFDWVKVVIEYPDLRPYFYENKAVVGNSQEAERASTLAELLCAHFEHAVLQMANLPDHIKPRWKDYMQGIYSTSPAIREHLKLHPDWYSDCLHELLKSK